MKRRDFSFIRSSLSLFNFNFRCVEFWHCDFRTENTEFSPFPPLTYTHTTLTRLKLVSRVHKKVQVYTVETWQLEGFADNMTSQHGRIILLCQHFSAFCFGRDFTIDQHENMFSLSNRIGIPSLIPSTNLIHLFNKENEEELGE